jgi:hypothetical protein
MSRQEWHWCAVWGCVVMAATLAPYLFVMGVAPPGHTFSGFMWNPDDHCVYLAWMAQARHGHFQMRNLFTGDPQEGLTIHLFFWSLGRIGALLNLPSPTVYHAARFLFGVTTLLLAYRLLAFFTPDRRTRRLGFWLVALSAGFGWVPYFWNLGSQGPVDVWQPEAITFASLYTNGLFCIGLTLMLGIVCLLLQASETRRKRFAVGAGVLGFLLANVHGYDVITLAAVWGAYLVTKAVVERRLPLFDLGMAAIAAILALPAVGYQLYVFKVDPVFSQRVEVPTTSPALWRYLLGYGLLLPLAGVGAWRGLTSPPCPPPRSGEGEGTASELSYPLSASGRGPGEGSSRAAALLLPVWSVVGFVVPYLPVAFQRKMVMGLHIPLALLAAQGAVRLMERLVRREPPTEAGAKPVRAARFRPGAILLFGLVLLTALSNVRYPIRDVNKAVLNQASTGIHPVFWADSEYAAMRWLTDHVPESAVVLSSTVIGSMIPAVAGRAVYAGHWGETPRFTERFQEVYTFYRLAWPSAEREAFLRSRGITHVYLGPWEQNLRRVRNDRYPAPPTPLDLSRESYLRRVYPAHGQPEPGPEGVRIYELRP